MHNTNAQAIKIDQIVCDCVEKEIATAAALLTESQSGDGITPKYVDVMWCSLQVGGALSVLY